MSANIMRFRVTDKAKITPDVHKYSRKFLIGRYSIKVYIPNKSISPFYYHIEMARYLCSFSGE